MEADFDDYKLVFSGRASEADLEDYMLVISGRAFEADPEYCESEISGRETDSVCYVLVKSSLVLQMMTRTTSLEVATQKIV